MSVVVIVIKEDVVFTLLQQLGDEEEYSFLIPFYNKPIVKLKDHYRMLLLHDTL